MAKAVEVVDDQAKEHFRETGQFVTWQVRHEMIKEIADGLTQLFFTVDDTADCPAGMKLHTYR